MDTKLLGMLLYEDEGTSLDFKRDEYPFDGADDATKSELLKDIIAFANSWRRSDAYVLIGVNEVKGGRSIPVGVSTHPDDAKLQQFVNSKTNRPVAFSYQTANIDGVQVGVIHIELQERPFFLKKDYGKLKAGLVYIKRGSSTDTADPGEVHRMGAASAREEKPQLEKPALEATLTNISYVIVHRHGNEWLFVELKLGFVIVNSGRVASHNWTVVVEQIDGHNSSRSDDYKFNRRAFPEGATGQDNRRIDGPILPSLSYATDLPFGVYLRPDVWSVENIKAEFERMLPPTLSLGFRAVSESSPGYRVTSPISSVFDAEDTLRRILERS